MADVIDELAIEVSASSKDAEGSINRLILKLDKLTASIQNIQNNGIADLANSISQLATSMQAVTSVKTASFSRLAENINKLSSFNASRLQEIPKALNELVVSLNQMSAVSQNAQNVGVLAGNIAKLGQKSTTNAIANIPLLTKGLNDLLVTLSKAPTVSTNVIQMTNALANLATQGSKVGTSSTSLVRGLNRYSSASNRASKSTFSLAAAFGKFYASYFLIIRGLKGVWSSIESTADYIEAYNYYNVAFGKIASDWEQDWEKYGYQNGDAYAQSFTDRMNDVMSKFSGVQIDLDTGLFTETGLKNLGMNIQEVTQFASQLASVTNSVGQVGEVSLATAESITRLAGDISSLFNVDFKDVATNLQSGLIGQSRALYKYGIDITQATLQTYAFGLGLEKSVSEMTQAEKMQLRLIAILDQSKVSWGDLANTIQSPSNQIRQLSNNIAELGNVFGQLFIPMLSKVLPYVNGLTIALKRLFVNLASFMGIDIDLDAFGQGYNDSLDDTAGEFEDVADAIEKTNKALRGFDELKTITSADTVSLSGIDESGNTIDLTDEIKKASEEYQRVWDEAFDNMENEAQAFADRITPHLMSIVNTIDKISPALQVAIGAFAAVGTVKVIENFGGYFKKVSDNILGFMENFEATGRMLDFDTITGTFRDAMSPAAKFTTGMLAVVASFQGVSDAVYDITLENESLMESFAQIGISAGLSASAMYTAFGPAGVAIAALSALVGAAKGAKDAVDNIVSESVGKSIKDALTNPGGTSLSILTENFRTSLVNAGSGFLTITNKSKMLSTANTNIRDTWKEIENIQTAMDNGVLSVEQGKKELERLFGELATLAETKFTAMSDSIVAALGENGAFRNAMLALGAPVEEGIDLIIENGYRNSERVKEIVEQMSNAEYGSATFKELQKELYTLTTGYDDVSKAASDFSYTLSQIDFSEFITDGGLDSKKLANELGLISNAYKEYISNVDNSAKELRAIYDELLASPNATSAEKKIAEDMIYYISQSTGFVTEKQKGEFEEILSSIQKGLFAEVSDVIKNAQKEYEEMNWFQKILVGSEDKLVKEAVDEFSSQFEEANKEIEKITEQFGLSLSDSYMDIFDDLFSSRVTHSDLGGHGIAYELKEDWEQILNDSVGIGENVGKGIEQGVNKSSDSAINSMGTLGNSMLNKFANVCKIHSPSKVMEEYGKYLIDGLVNGISDNMERVFDVVDGMGEKIQTKLYTYGFEPASFGASSYSYVNEAFSKNRNYGYSIGNSLKNVTNATKESIVVDVTLDLDGDTIYKNMLQRETQRASTGKNSFKTVALHN